MRRPQELIVEHNRGHWYVDEPHRGCAYRALTSTTNACDPMLLRAAEAAGVKDLLTTFCKQFSDVGEVIMWVRAAAARAHFRARRPLSPLPARLPPTQASPPLCLECRSALALES